MDRIMISDEEYSGRKKAAQKEECPPEPQVRPGMAELKLKGIAHGGDYNPEQWLDRPDILQEDIRLMKLAGCDLMSVGIFAWSFLEPEEGQYDFDWLEGILDRLHGAGISVLLATPSGARPPWMSRRYPEVLRVNGDGVRALHGERQNHCFTSPVYRGFVRRMDRALAQRLGGHPAVVGWHVSNEYGGECHCELCQEAFRGWLRQRYGSLEALNRAWWTGFWSKRYTDWDQLHSPCRRGEGSIHGLNLAWKRFVTHQTADFLRAEAEPLRKITPHLPIACNLMEMFGGLDYGELVREMDFAGIDSYPEWGAADAEMTALRAAFNFDWMRTLKQKPFALMESAPSQVSWREVCKLKKPGMHTLACLQAVAHGADTVQYFQWRKSRGGAEKFHGAVVDHAGHEHTRTFREVAEVGRLLPRLKGAAGTLLQSPVALIFDTQNRWALEDCRGPRADMGYADAVMEHYRALKRLGVNVDIPDQTRPVEGYRLVVAPMLYMLRPGMAQRLEAFVRGGGTLVCTCPTGWVDQDDLCFEGGFPGPLKDVLGIWIEETDALYDDERNGMRTPEGKVFPCGALCDVIHPRGARVLATYDSDFYAGTPCVTENRLGEGRAFYIATRPGADFLDAFYARVMKSAGVAPLLPHVPRGVQVTRRGDMLFVMNFSRGPARVTLPGGVDVLTGERTGGDTVLPEYGCRVVAGSGEGAPGAE